MIELVLQELEVLSNGFNISWSITGDTKEIFKQTPVKVNYAQNIKVDEFVAVNFFISLFVPVLYYYYKQVSVHIPYKLGPSILNYWDSYLSTMGKELSITNQYVFHHQGKSLNFSSFHTDKINKIGLLFGGGVESSFALSQICHLNPVLLSITGDGWMNNDHSKSSIKRELEDELVEDCKVNLQRIETNSRSIVNLKDACVNNLHTGLLFYFISLPVCKAFNINTIYKTAELESVNNFTNYDYSLKSTNAINITVKENGLPIFLSVFNSFSKVKMFEYLVKSKFVKYVYSCIRYGDTRWCGECNKCFRISTYCDFLGIPKSVIGMQEGIAGVKEKKPNTKIYYEILDKQFGKHRFYYLKKKIQFYRNKGRIGLLRYILKKHLHLAK